MYFLSKNWSAAIILWKFTSRKFTFPCIVVLSYVCYTRNIICPSIDIFFNVLISFFFVGISSILVLLELPIPVRSYNIIIIVGIPFLDALVHCFPFIAQIFA